MRWAFIVASAGLLVLGGCAHAPISKPVARARAPETAPATPPVVASAATSAPAPALPFHLPCAGDDLEACSTGCAEHHAEDCVTLAAMYLSGSLVTRDADRAISLLRAACDEGSARGCLRLGDAYHAGVVVGDAEEVDCYRRACDAGANQGCVAEAKAYLTGHGVTTDAGFAAALFGRACERGNAPACFELARLYKEGEGVKVNEARAFELFRKACKLGLDEGCLLASRTEETLPPRDE